jgi:hypothetical protein
MTKIDETVVFLLNKIEHMGMQEALCDPEGLEELEEIDKELFQLIIDYRRSKIWIDKHLKKKYSWVYNSVVKQEDDE